ncbi:MAG: T9SS type A sorting domain-containing protein, partial [Bacteroidetes bacterium]|nr:T9SS type A sorting domain-containing protein [Bacteroidota bacterium]MBU2584501.1 T9SS type A sorting domain-containing protein [Bacteroidota bacterium]
LRAMAFRNDTIGYAVGDSGTILFTSNGGVTFIDEEPNMPYTFVLQQNYPNPFNPSTTIEFSLPVRSRGILKIFNILGEEIEVLVNGELEAGEHLINWEAKNLPSGIYFYRLITDNFNITRKMVLLR